MAGTFTFHDQAFFDLVNNPRGGVAREMRRHGNQIVSEVKELLNVPADKSRNARNPPPGPPRKRTGDLRASVRLAQTFATGNRELVFGITAGSVHPRTSDPRAVGLGSQYAPILLSKGYTMVPARIKTKSR